MPAQQDRDIAEHVMGWNLRGNRWFDGNTDTGLRLTTWKPSEDVVGAQRALKKWVTPNKTARTVEPDGGQVEATLFEENLQTIDGVPVNVGLETKRATAGTLPAAVCAMALS